MTHYNNTSTAMNTLLFIVLNLNIYFVLSFTPTVSNGVPILSIPFVSEATMTRTRTSTSTGSTCCTTHRSCCSSLSMTKLVYNGKAKDFPAGTPLSRAAAQLGVPVKYSCKKGECATCQIRVAGQNMKCCIGKVPAEPRLKSLQEKGLEIRV